MLVSVGAAARTAPSPVSEDWPLCCRRGFSLAGLRRRGVLGLPLVDSRPRLRARLGGRVDPPHLPLLVLLSRGELVLSRGELLVSARWGEP